MKDDTPEKLEDRTNEKLNALESDGHVIQSVRVDVAFGRDRFYSVITYTEDIS